MKKLRQFLSIFMTILIFTTIITTSSINVNAASKTPAFTINAVSNLTDNNAKISARITNPNKTKISRVGFQLGTASNKLTITKYDNVNKTYSYVDASFLMSKYKITLKANTTYYYRFYINTGNKNYYSSVKSFKTKSTPEFTINSVTSLTYNNAKISARITNPNKTKISKVGFQLGTASNNLTTNKYDNVNKTHNYVDASFLMSKYKVTLKANTTYYYRFYIVTGGKTYYSSVNNFKTKSDAPTISYNKVSELTYNNATINGSLSNPKNITINKIGFQLGTSKNKLTTNKYYNFNNKVTSKNLTFKMSSYKLTLKENTTYYYRIYVTSGSKTYYGSVQSFKTPLKVKYSPIKSLSISRIVQTDSTSCYLSSISTLYGYKVGTYSGVNYKVGGKDISQSSSNLYKNILSKNKSYNKRDKNGQSDVWVNASTITNYGFKKQSYNLTNIYNSLKAGKPVVIYNGIHASLVIGYKGNSNSLKTSDFIVMEIKKDGNAWKNSTSYFNTYSNNPQKMGDWKSCYVTLDSWISYTKATPTIMVTY